MTKKKPPEQHISRKKPKNPLLKKTIDKNIVYDCGLKGLPLKYVYHACGVSHDTWHRNCKADPEIYEKYKSGLQKNCEELMAHIKAISIETKNMAGLIFLAKCVHGLREQVQLNHVGASEDQPIKIQSELEVKIDAMTPEQRKARIAELELKRVNER